jgi:FlaA1/EpsC-like NDP-sugar epimerase
MPKMNLSHLGYCEPRSNGLQKVPNVRMAVKLALDACLAGLAMVVASLLLREQLPHFTSLAGYIALAMAVNVGFKFYTQHYRMVGVEEARRLMIGNIILLAAAMVSNYLRTRGGGFSLATSQVVLGASLLTGPMWFALRLGCMANYKRRFRRPLGEADASLAKRTLIVGAGRAGILLCQELREHPRLQCNILGFVDDDLDKQGVQIDGIQVLGPTELLPTYIRETKATQVILAMAGVTGARLKGIADLVRAEGILFKTVPGILDLVGDRPWKPELRDIAIEDLLRREPIELDTVAIRAALQGEVVLITGAGGSIGSELARQVAEMQPRQLVLLGRGENSLWGVQRELAQQFPGLTSAIALCDIRNPERLCQVFKTFRPSVVMHAAAHKHVPFLEESPEEAVENNIFGTRNVMDAALDWGCRTLVNISTDKAVNPVSVLGASKRIAELVIANEAQKAGSEVRLISVRFGNVLGSRGSVIPIFKDQIRLGGPVTVTHPDMVRYFMTIPEAAQLVLQAGLLGETGKVFVLDMGAPVRIVDLAQEMVRLSGFTPGVDMQIRFTGVRPGEKLFEELFTSAEEKQSQVHPKVFESEQHPYDADLLEGNLGTLQTILANPARGRQKEILDCFMRLVPTYRPSPLGMGRLLVPGSTRTHGTSTPAAAPPVPPRPLEVRADLTVIA